MAKCFGKYWQSSGDKRSQEANGLQSCARNVILTKKNDESNIIYGANI